MARGSIPSILLGKRCALHAGVRGRGGAEVGSDREQDERDDGGGDQDQDEDAELASEAAGAAIGNQPVEEPEEARVAGVAAAGTGADQGQGPIHWLAAVRAVETGDAASGT